MNHLEKLVRRCGGLLENWPVGTVISRQGCVGEILYVIARGRAVHLSESGRSFATTTTLGEGDCFGGLSLLISGPAAETVQTAEPTTTLSLSRAALRSLWQADPLVAAELVAELVRTLAATDRRAPLETEHSKKENTPWTSNIT